MNKEQIDILYYSIKHLKEKYKNLKLERNTCSNLAIFVDEKCIGYISLNDGEIYYFYENNQND